MKKHIFKLVVFLFASQNLIYAQHILKDQSDVNWYKSIHQEKVFVHHNASLLFTGEYLYYKLYCLNSTSNKLSNTSKIGYVELIGEDGESIFRHKIKLEKGLGQGDFFVPTSIPSGNYKLLAYTQWMKNGEGNHFFSSDISIINPYRGNQSNVMASVSTYPDLNYNRNDIKNYSKANALSYRKANDKIVISPSSRTFNNRSKVSVIIKSLKGNRSFGNYSISVRKIDTILMPDMPVSTNYSQLFKSNKSKVKAIHDEIFMPEFKGEMVTGKLWDKGTNVVVSNKDIALSIAANECVLNITTTNDDGVFYFHLNSDYNGDDAVLQVLDDYPENFKIVLNNYESINPKDLKFHQFKINSKMKTLILERSINNQIQNGYFSVKPDTIKTMEPEAPFYGNHQDVYLLDDYTRFPTVKETVIEIIEHAWTAKNKEGNQVLIVRGREFDPYFGSELEALVMVDGIFIKNHEDIIEYETKKVKSINVLRDEYYYGSQIYKGVISITTIKGEYNKELNEKYLSKVKLFKPRQRKHYFNQRYNETTILEASRIPDFRQQLLWMPEFVLNGTQKTIEFFTSDTKGVYEISLEGFTNQGEPVSVKERIQVE